MTEAARRILDTDGSPYDQGMQLMADLVLSVPESAGFGAADLMWASLTDGIDGPDRLARELSEAEIEDLMRLAAREWLELDPSEAELRRYFARWEDWPDSLGEVRG